MMGNFSFLSCILKLRRGRKHRLRQAEKAPKGMNPRHFPAFLLLFPAKRLQDMLSAALLIRHRGGMDDLDRARVRTVPASHLLVELAHRSVDVHVPELLSRLSRRMKRHDSRPLGPLRGFSTACR